MLARRVKGKRRRGLRDCCMERRPAQLGIAFLRESAYLWAQFDGQMLAMLARASHVGG